MRKVTVIVVTIMIVSLLVGTRAYATVCNEQSSEATEQTILRLLSNAVHDAIEDYYGEPRQYWNDKLLSVHKVSNAPFYEVIMQVETFYDPHNPPYGIETMTFYVSYGKVELIEFEHQDDPVYKGGADKILDYLYGIPKTLPILNRTHSTQRASSVVQGVHADRQTA